ncbi:MAG TPA: hypothetical protein VJZ03_07880 [Candidatus Bathyarchaeia archaeon]|nr:hypothetical protein [Candidatus Bathyarchaeia archaeon]
MAAKPPLERVQESERLLERIMLSIPGFSGYKLKEQRREADRIVRDYIYNLLAHSRDDLSRCFQILNEAKLTEILEPTNQLIARLDRVAEKINRAAYGYSAFFDSARIDTPQLDQMLQYDTQLTDAARKIVDMISNFKTNLTENKLEDARDIELQISDSITELEDAFDKRKLMIEGVTV